MHSWGGRGTRQEERRLQSWNRRGVAPGRGRGLARSLKGPEPQRGSCSRAKSGHREHLGTDTRKGLLGVLQIAI